MEAQIPRISRPGGCQGGGQAASDEFPAAAGAGSLDGRGREGGIVQQQGVGGYAEEPAQPHHMLGIGSGGAQLPFGEGLPGDPDLIGKLFLGPVLFFSEVLKFSPNVMEASCFGIRAGIFLRPIVPSPREKVHQGGFTSAHPDFPSPFSQKKGRIG